jgi:hypothetical protein
VIVPWSDAPEAILADALKTVFVRGVLAAWSRRGVTGQATRDRRAERPVPEAA